MTPDHDVSQDATASNPSAPRASVLDHRETPRGVLPRQLQMWLMIGIALLILLIIYATGRPEPADRQRTESSSTAPSSLPPDRVKGYQQRLTEQEARLRQDLADAEHTESGIAPPLVEAPAPAVDPLEEDRRRREYQSLFADNIAMSRRPPDERPFVQREVHAQPQAPDMTPPVAPWANLPPETRPPAAVGPPPAPVNTAALGVDRTSAASSASTAGVDLAAAKAATDTPPIAPGGPIHRLSEGTFIDAVLTNRLEGSFAGAVNCMVTTPLYSHSRQHVVIPTGARLLGTATPVQAWGESRLAVRFHRLLMPDGRSYSLDRFTGLNQAGDAGLKDQVNRHYLQVFGASLAIGALSGLTQYQTRGAADPAYGFEDAYGQGMGSSLAASTGRVLDRFLNVLPTITIREGHRIKVYLTSDLDLPEYHTGPQPR